MAITTHFFFSLLIAYAFSRLCSSIRSFYSWAQTKRTAHIQGVLFSWSSAGTEWNKTKSLKCTEGWQSTLSPQRNTAKVGREYRTESNSCFLLQFTSLVKNTYFLPIQLNLSPQRFQMSHPIILTDLKCESSWSISGQGAVLLNPLSVNWEDKLWLLSNIHAHACIP